MSLILNVEILGEFQKLTKATQGAEGSLANLNDKVNSVSSGIGKAIGGIAIALGFTGIVQGLKDAVAAAEEAQVANERIDAIAKSMDLFGTETKKTTDRIKQFAEDQELLVGVDAETIKATQAKLLTFKEITKTAGTMGGAFDRATILAQDLAAAGFGEATSNATQLGKALNDPTEGISALTRVGLTFTEEQKKVIRSLQDTGDMAGAQEIILKELETQVGGTAAATVTDTEKMKIAFERVSEEIGTALLPLLEQFTTWLTSPEGQETLDLVIEGITAIVEEGIKLVEWVIDNKDFLVPMVAAIGGVTTAWNLATTAVGAFKTATGIAAAVSGSPILATGAALAGSATGGFMEGQQVIQNANIYSGGSRYEDGNGLFGNAFKPVPQTVNININNGNVNPQQVADAINRANRASRTSLIRNFE
jgi:hypothetical protein